MMNKIIKIKQGDTYPPLDATFIDETKVPINLTDADVFVSMGNGMGTKKINRKPVTVIDALKGKVKYNWSATDTDSVGTYQLEFEVNFDDGSILTIPTSDVITVQVIKKIK